MRVISGMSRGMKLKTIEGIETRPTVDRIKETLFNIIAFDLEGSCFLDLFSGSGQIGIEALSRGAREVIFIENNNACVDIINYNLTHTKLLCGAQVLDKDVLIELNRLGSDNKKFDIIFLDPPYESGIYEEVFRIIVDKRLLNKDGLIIAERKSDIEFRDLCGLYIKREKKYKTTTLSFLTLEE